MKKLVVLAAVVAFLMVVLPGPLYKFGLVDLGPAFISLRSGVYVGGAAVLLLIVQAVFFRQTMSTKTTVAAFLCIVIAVGMPVSMMQKAKAVPAIHDITTDVENPPQFVAVLPLRANASNPPDYAGDEIAAQQKQAYPDLAAQSFSQSAEDVLRAADAVISDFGWSKAEGSAPNTLEATHETFWFGFKDDVVIRVIESGDSTLVDVRSKSRVGRSDLGKNAERIRDFQAALAKKLG